MPTPPGRERSMENPCIAVSFAPADDCPLPPADCATVLLALAPIPVLSDDNVFLNLEESSKISFQLLKIFSPDRRRERSTFRIFVLAVILRALTRFFQTVLVLSSLSTIAVERYINYSQIAARVVRRALKADLRSEALKRDEVNVKFTRWKDGKPA
ncbi:unnamed protein product, partial [Heterotrigona itama]